MGCRGSTSELQLGGRGDPWLQRSHTAATGRESALSPVRGERQQSLRWTSRLSLRGPTAHGGGTAERSSETGSLRIPSRRTLDDAHARDSGHSGWERISTRRRTQKRAASRLCFSRCRHVENSLHAERPVPWIIPVSSCSVRYKHARFVVFVSIPNRVCEPSIWVCSIAPPLRPSSRLSLHSPRVRCGRLLQPPRSPIHCDR